jgi:hypothetical protein
MRSTPGAYLGVEHWKGGVGEVCLVPVPIWVSLLNVSNLITSIGDLFLTMFDSKLLTLVIFLSQSYLNILLRWIYWTSNSGLSRTTKLFQGKTLNYAASGSSTVVVHSPHIHKVRGSWQASDTAPGTEKRRNYVEKSEGASTTRKPFISYDLIIIRSPY